MNPTETPSPSSADEAKPLDAKGFGEEELERRRRALSKIMAEPTILRTDDELAKTRFRLLSTAGLSIVFVVADLHIKPGANFMGFSLENLTDAVVRTGLTVVVLYLLVHFVWGSTDGLREWRLRLTGARAAVSDGWKGRNLTDWDTSTEPRHSTLYAWWNEQAGDRAEFYRLLAGISGDRPEGALPPLFRQQIDRYRMYTLENPRISESLKRYDAWHIALAISENRRWIIFDFAMPMVVGCAALVLLILKAALRC